MRSKVLREMSQARARRMAAMSPAERVALTGRLARQGIAAYMATYAVDRRTAIARIKATRRLGRRRSPCADDDEC